MGVPDIVLALELNLQRLLYPLDGSIVFGVIVKVVDGLNCDPIGSNPREVVEFRIDTKDDGEQVIVRAIDAHKIHREPTLIVEVLGVRVDQLRGDRFDGNPTARDKSIKFEVVLHGFQGILRGCSSCILERDG